MAVTKIDHIELIVNRFDEYPGPGRRRQRRAGVGAGHLAYDSARSRRTGGFSSSTPPAARPT